ncbi:hypothetical protein GCM10009555_039130 [Acrocarpospora macrocephala]
MTGQAAMLRVARAGASVVPCAGLSQAVNVSCCPLPPSLRAGGINNAVARGLGYATVVEPDAKAASLPVRTIFVKTDGTLAARPHPGRDRDAGARLLRVVRLHARVPPPSIRGGCRRPDLGAREARPPFVK